MKKAHDILRTLLLIFLGVFIGCGVYFWNANNLTGNRLPMPFGVGAAVVLSGSMEPVLSVNDLVWIQAQEQYEEGDVVVYQDGDSLVIHRILSIDGETVVTKGDANKSADDPITLSDIKGKQVGTWRGIGSVVRALKTPAGIVLILAVAIGLLILSNRKESSRRAENLDDLRRQIAELKRQNGEDERK